MPVEAFRHVRPFVVACAAVALSVAGCSSGDDDAGSTTTTAPPTTEESDATTTTVPSANGERTDGEVPMGAAVDIPALVREIQPSVVSIDVVTPAGRAAGSGVIIDEDGLVVTNAHVVSTAEEVDVILADGTRLQGTVEAADVFTDLAIVQVDREGLPAADLADRYPTVGEIAVAVGNPLGFENTVTAGIVSGIQRAIPGSASQGGQALVDLIQTDAAISPGNSGGALVDAGGDIIGINVAYIPPVSGAVSLGFAIPSPTVADVVAELAEDGQVDHPFLGVQLGTVTPEIAERLGIDAEAGAALIDVVPDGPADRAGLEAADVVVEAAGQPIRDVGALLTQLRSFAPGDDLELGIIRDGQEMSLTVELGSRPVT